MEWSLKSLWMIICKRHITANTDLRSMIDTIFENEYNTPSNKHTIEIRSIWQDKTYLKNTASLVAR